MANKTRASEASLDWAASEFGHVDLGDTRRTERLVGMAAGACERPSGKVAAVFPSDAEREGAYDLLESKLVPVEEVAQGPVAATVQRCAEHPFVFVPVDGSSVTVVDRAGRATWDASAPTAMGRGGSRSSMRWRWTPAARPWVCSH